MKLIVIPSEHCLFAVAPEEGAGGYDSGDGPSLRKVIIRLTLSVAEFSTKQALRKSPGRAC